MAERSKATVARLGQPFKPVINEALRIVLDQLQQPPKSRPYRTKPHRMGLRPGLSLDNIGDLLAQVEGEDAP